MVLNLLLVEGRTGLAAITRSGYVAGGGKGVGLSARVGDVGKGGRRLQGPCATRG